MIEHGHRRSRRAPRRAARRAVRRPRDPRGPRRRACSSTRCSATASRATARRTRRAARRSRAYVGKDIAPEWLSVYDDPQIVTLNGIQLNGFYRFDDEGVRGAARPARSITASSSAS